MRFAIYIVQQRPLVSKEWMKVTSHQGKVPTIPKESISRSASDGIVCMINETNYLLPGYKEFDTYLSSPKSSEKAFEAAVEHMKLSTRQYSRRQISWIRNKLLPAVYAMNSKNTVIPIYLLDATGDPFSILKCF
jgi:hypothetical protein